LVYLRATPTGYAVDVNASYASRPRRFKDPEEARKCVVEAFERGGFDKVPLNITFLRVKAP
jgi:hypothetical protein